MPERRGLARAGTLVGLGAIAVLAVVRTALAQRLVDAPRPAAPADDLARADVLVPVRSGDPLLPGRLALQAEALAPARVRLLVDDDDPAGIAAADHAADGRAHVAVVACPPPAPGTNPKTHKLALAAAGSDDVVVMLDDDAVLPAGGLARLVGGLGADGDGAGGDGAALVTGIPVYSAEGGRWSTLVAAFVNSSALPTYLALAASGPPISVNGMVLATRRRHLAAIGGLERLLDATCDDYAIALAFRRHGLPIAQLAEPVVLATTVDSAAAYARLMRRWMMFAHEVVRRDLSPRFVLLVLVPAALPLITLAAAVGAGGAWPAAVLALLGGQSAGTRALRRRLVPDGAVHTSPARTLVLETLALLLAPAHAVAAIGVRTVRWRGRLVRVGVGRAAGPVRRSRARIGHGR
ncbi:glycosyltransferase [Litorihabitans aurantiacus]|uniref:Ceramide glucosyltransferase n=1 Tax=Litorihabitans aurantiacus TaxID=1930061 RepID=A0AA38CS88_9MICO|nr:glycosyltransferase [Litorihabitans aurantiacus]GMA31434.1 hypothetical protein GCM10025875_14260 [Litorihabitans aurantiacus]